MSWLRVLPALFAVMVVGCEKRSLEPDGGSGMIGVGTGGVGTGVGGSSSGGFDARPDIPSIPVPDYNRCGNARVDPGEDCDDGNKSAGDGCSPICQAECFESCGWCGGS